MDGEFCCFLSEDEAESDFNWFASVFYFISLVIYRIIFDWKDMKVDSTEEWMTKTHTEWKSFRIKTALKLFCFCLSMPEEFSRPTHLKELTFANANPACRMEFIWLSTENEVFVFIPLVRFVSWEMDFFSTVSLKERCKAVKVINFWFHSLMWGFSSCFLNVFWCFFV